MIGAELTLLDRTTLDFLTNKELYQMAREITQSKELSQDNSFIVWEAVSPTAKYKAIFNITSTTQELPATLLGAEYEGADEIWTGQKAVSNAVIPSHGVALFKIAE